MAAGIAYVQQHGIQILNLCSEGVIDVLTALSVRVIRNLHSIRTQLSAVSGGRVSPGEPGSPQRSLFDRLWGCDYGFEPIAPAPGVEFRSSRGPLSGKEGGFGSPTKFDYM